MMLRSEKYLERLKEVKKELAFEMERKNEKT